MPARSGPRTRRKGGDLGQYLLERGFITEQQLEHAREVQGASRSELGEKNIGRVLMDLGYITMGQLTQVMATLMGHDFVDLADYPIDPVAAAVLPLRVAQRHRAVPIGFDEDRLIVAVADPTDVLALDDIRTITGRTIKIVIATRSDIEDAIARIVALDRSADSLFDQAALPEEEEEKGLEAATDDAPIVKAINTVIAEAVNQRASDIHVEPGEKDVRIRYRIDGVLHEQRRVQKNLQSGMISRLKVMSDLNIAEKRVPQDGRVTVSVNKRQIDLRVATLPSVWGEKVVMRILDRSTGVSKLEELGFLDDSLKRFAESYTKPYGAILVTGPTGSGKSTTLYSTLNIVNDPTRNTITVEDPVEYRMAGITQVQVHPRAGLTFAAALRSILRADPDIVMVGEIRDRETATIAVEAALTGHLVLSTLHTNDAPSAITRLTEMGVEPFLVASAVDCILAQRLSRRLCDKCKEAYTPTPESLQENGFPWTPGEPLPQLYRAVGCQHCAKYGFRGRVAIVEVMPVTEEIERLTVERRSSEEIKRVAIEQGMKTLREDGIEKAQLGLTTIEEVLRVVV